MCSVDISVIYLSPGKPNVSRHHMLMSFHCVSFSAPAPQSMVTGQSYPGSRKIGFSNILVDPFYARCSVIQVIVRDAKMIAKTLTISDAV